MTHLGKNEYRIAGGGNRPNKTVTKDKLEAYIERIPKKINKAYETLGIIK